MSADNGYIIRKNKAGKYVLQMYFDSSDVLPNVENYGAPVFDTLEDAVLRFEEMYDEAIKNGVVFCEYGLSIDVTPRPGKTHHYQGESHG